MHGNLTQVPLKVMQLPYHVALGTLITQEFIEKERARLGNLFALEYECAFISSGKAAIEPELLERCKGGDFELEPMPKWSKEATEFKVSVSYHETRGYQIYVPRPIVEHLGIRTRKEDDPKPISFIIKGHRVEVRASTGT